MDLDATDTAILRCLQQDARLSLRRIAKEVGVSVPTVSARLQNLEALGIVRGYRAVLDPARLNQTTVTLVVQTKKPVTETVAAGIARSGWARRVLTGRPGWILVDATAAQPDGIDSIRKEIASLPGVLEIEAYTDQKAVKDEPQAVLTNSLSTSLVCFECKGPIHGDPVRVRHDGRYHYFCCHTCERLFLDKYERIRAAAGKGR